MRSLVLAVTVLTLAACGEQKPAEPAADAPQPAAEAVSPSGPDAGATEVAAVPPPSIAPTDVPSLIEGKWRPNDSTQPVISITPDGSWTEDSASGGAPNVSEWRAMFGGEAKKASPNQSFTPTATYIEVISATEAARYYQLGAISEDNLELTYVGHGNSQIYSRVK